MRNRDDNKIDFCFRHVTYVVYGVGIGSPRIMNLSISEVGTHLFIQFCCIRQS